MRCKKHYTDYSSTVGVCACCLRERLLSLVAAQEQSQSLVQIQNPDGKQSKHRNSDQNPAIPRSVSPYTHNRRRNQSTGAVACSDYNIRTDYHHHHHHRHSLSDQLFYQTPQVRINSDGENGNIGVNLNSSNKKSSFVRFLSFSNIFRSRNRKSIGSVSDLTESDSAFREPCVPDNATSSPSLFSNIVHRNRHRRNPSIQSVQSVNVDESTVTAGNGAVRRPIFRDRGMSPERNLNESNNATNENEFQSTESWKNTPRRTPARRGGGGGNIRNLTFCLSPLVRASPNRKWNQKVMPPECLQSGEIRVPVKANLCNTKSFQANRSRKLADFGRLNHNR